VEVAAWKRGCRGGGNVLTQSEEKRGAMVRVWEEMPSAGKRSDSFARVHQVWVAFLLCVGAAYRDRSSTCICASALPASMAHLQQHQ
jgi:hypothetical protein